jgi:hypothetical protein
VQDEGFHGLALGLQFNRKLVMLDLTRCGLTDKGLKTLDRVLEQVGGGKGGGQGGGTLM